MTKNMAPEDLPVITPEPLQTQVYSNAGQAVAALQALYNQASQFLRAHFEAVMAGEAPQGRYRAFYPQVSITTTTLSKFWV